MWGIDYFSAFAEMGRGNSEFRIANFEVRMYKREYRRNIFGGMPIYNEVVKNEEH